jgi:hypothetical protein
MGLVIFAWRRAVRRFVPRHYDALAGRAGRPDWSVVLRRGVLQGFLGGSRVWIVLGGLAAVIRLTYKLGEGSGDVLLTEVLHAGEGLLVSDTGVERRAAGSAAN